jgi:signal transduction histidine kinase
MTLGTSPQWGILSPPGAGIIEHRGMRRWPTHAGSRFNRQWWAKAAAAMHLLGLAAIVTMGWHDPSVAVPGTIGGLQAMHLAFLMTTGAAAAFLTLGADREDQPVDVPEDTNAATGVDQLMAQMSHELRTPLNAMIGFSDVMLRELYGPLGHTRYQEYAAHISESGGQLLRSAEDALAVTETMSAVMADRLAGRCERVAAGGLVREAWTALGATSVKLSVSNCAACDIPCERRATGQALRHLLREAIARAPAGGEVEVKGRRRGGARSIEIRITNGSGQPAGSILDGAAKNDAGRYPLAGGSLRVMLARLLLEMQGATLSLWDDDAGFWSAYVAFPPRG